MRLSRLPIPLVYRPVWLIVDKGNSTRDLHQRNGKCNSLPAFEDDVDLGPGFTSRNMHDAVPRAKVGILVLHPARTSMIDWILLDE